MNTNLDMEMNGKILFAYVRIIDKEQDRNYKVLH